MKTMIQVLVAAVLLISSFTLSACSRKPAGETSEEKPPASAPAKRAAIYAPDMARCAGFTAADAAAILHVPADRITVTSEEGYEGFWQCSFATDSFTNSIAFSVTIADSVKEAVSDMEQYRSNLEFAGSTKAFKDDAAGGAYSDISGVGDEAVWTRINGTLSVRKGNITLQVNLPPEKLKQIEVAAAFVGKLSDSEQGR